ncbi:MAG TPA: nuclear transport factor 2 family protein [Rectinemataceae bacterium]
MLRWIEALNSGGESAAQAYMAPDCRIEGAPDIGPGERLEIEEILGFGSRCILRWRIAVSEMHGLDMFRIRDGLIVERLSYRSTKP